VKCDEGKPSCNRCLKFGVTCDGYASNKQPSPVPYILPKERPPGSSNTAESTFSLPLPLPRPLPVPPERILPSTHSSTEETDWNRRPFQNYYNEAAAHIRGIFQTSFWEKLASPEICRESPFIQHGIIAVGTLSRLSQRETNIDPAIMDRISAQMSTGYSYALNHYDQALQGSRAAIANGQNNIRKALIACLLVFCFESLQGNQDSAIMQARSCLKLLDDWILSKQALGGSDPIDDGILGQDLMDAFVALEWA
jgi:hypothetical protein